MTKRKRIIFAIFAVLCIWAIWRFGKYPQRIKIETEGIHYYEHTKTTGTAQIKIDGWYFKSIRRQGYNVFEGSISILTDGSKYTNEDAQIVVCKDNVYWGVVRFQYGGTRYIILQDGFNNFIIEFCNIDGSYIVVGEGKNLLEQIDNLKMYMDL